MINEPGPGGLLGVDNLIWSGTRLPADSAGKYQGQTGITIPKVISGG